MSDIQQLLERYRRAPEVLAVVLTGVFGEEEDFSPAPDKWSIRQVMAHLADTELTYAFRFRQVIAEDHPTLIGFNQEAWARNLDYRHRKPKQSLESFRRTRAENYDILKDLPEATFARVGDHTERGPLALRDLLETGAQHAERHARQIEMLRTEYKKTKGKQ
jgi:DinB superfamily